MGRGINPKAWERVKDAVIRYEQGVKNQGEGVSESAPGIFSGGVYKAKASGSITARSGTTPGSGPADIVTYNGSALTTSGNRSITVWNHHNVSCTSGQYLTVFVEGGKCWLLSKDC